MTLFFEFQDNESFFFYLTPTKFYSSREVWRKNMLDDYIISEVDVNI